VLTLIILFIFIFILEKNIFFLIIKINMTTITRRIVKPTSSNSGGTYNESASNNLFESDKNDWDDGSKDDDRDTVDDKETRLTLMEEVLLLGLKDREVC